MDNHRLLRVEKVYPRRDAHRDREAPRPRQAPNAIVVRRRARGRHFARGAQHVCEGASLAQVHHHHHPVLASADAVDGQNVLRGQTNERRVIGAESYWPPAEACRSP